MARSYVWHDSHLNKLQHTPQHTLQHATWKLRQKAPNDSFQRGVLFTCAHVWFSFVTNACSGAHSWQTHICSAYSCMVLIRDECKSVLLIRDKRIWVVLTPYAWSSFVHVCDLVRDKCNCVILIHDRCMCGPYSCDMTPSCWDKAYIYIHIYICIYIYKYMYIYIHIKDTQKLDIGVSKQYKCIYVYMGWNIRIQIYIYMYIYIYIYIYVYKCICICIHMYIYICICIYIYIYIKQR